MEDILFKTTTKDFKAFEKECKYWIKKLSLLNWEWSFYHIKMDDRACVEYELGSRIVKVYFSKSWYNIKPIPKEIKKTAYHEVMEVLLGEIKLLSFDNDVEDINSDDAIHCIIHRLESTQFKDDYNRRYKR